jgi:hypothetical protein
MKEKKTGHSSNPEQKAKSNLRMQIAGRLVGVAFMISSLGFSADAHLDQIPFANNPLNELLYKEGDTNDYCLFISGGTGTNAGISGIKDGLEKAFGVGKVAMFNSVLNFEDPQNPERFEQMADIIQSCAKKKIGLDIVAHSLGAAELKEAIDVIEKRDPTFFDKKENVEKLHIILIAPSGFSEGFLGPIRFLSRVNERTQPPFNGIDALTAFPPEGINSEDLAIALRKAMPELSQLNADLPIETFSLVTEGDYSNKLIDSEKEQIKTYSDMMKIAITNQNYDGLRHLIIKYGEILKGPLEKVYAGSFESADAQTIEAAYATVGGYIEMIRVLIDGLGSGPMRELAKLQEKGITLYFIIPEYDVILTLNEAINFFDTPEEAYRHIKIAEGVAHGFLALQKDRFGEMIKDLGEGKTP